MGITHWNKKTMTLVTICPACSTQFFVTQAQLKANHGKVRCGQCKQVFNANEYLNELSVNEQISNEASIDPTNIDSLAETIPDEDTQVTPTQINVQALETEPTAELAEETIVTASTDAGTTAHAAQAVPQDSAAAVQLVEIIMRPEFVESEPAQIEDYFATTSKLKNTAAKKTPRWLMLLFMLTLLPLAVGQTIYYFRTPIASQFPQTKPYLVQACELIGCKVALPKRLDMLAIDDSEMREDVHYDHVLLFSITLINKANVALSYPSIELTLTDANDETVIRRTITPEKYLALNHNAAIGKIDAGIAAKDRLQLKLALNTNDMTTAGYRLELVE